MKEVRCADIVTLELEAATVPEPTTAREPLSSKKLEIDILDPRDEENELRGKPVEDLEDLLIGHRL